MTAALQAFFARVMSSLTEAQRERGSRREAAQVGIDAARWGALDERALDLPLLRDLHRAVGGAQDKVRRAKADGAWTLSDARPGQWRTKPQRFRVGEHVEAAPAPGAPSTGRADFRAAPQMRWTSS